MAGAEWQAPDIAAREPVTPVEARGTAIAGQIADVLDDAAFAAEQFRRVVDRPAPGVAERELGAAGQPLVERQLQSVIAGPGGRIAEGDRPGPL